MWRRLALAVTAAACGGDDDDDGELAATRRRADDDDRRMTEARGPAMSDAPFGAGVLAGADDGEGSVDGMADDPVATAASNNPLLSTLVSAVTRPTWSTRSTRADDITVFAPANTAFDAVDPATLEAAMADPSGLLTTVLTYHVVPGRLAPDELAGEHETLQGETLTVEGSGEDFTVNGGRRSCAATCRRPTRPSTSSTVCSLPPSAA